MEFLLYLESGLVHSSILTLATILCLKALDKFYQSVFSFNKNNLELKQRHSALLKNKELIVRKAFEDAGLKHSISFNHLDFDLHPFHVVAQKEFKQFCLAQKATFLLIDDNSDNAEPGWELQTKNDDQWQQGYLSFEIDGKPYVGELTLRHMAYIEDNFLLQDNSDKPVHLGVVNIILENKVIIQTSGAFLHLPDSQLYAIACHEAMHVKYHHNAIKSAALLESLYVTFKFNNYLLGFLPSLVAYPAAFLLTLAFIKKIYVPFISSALSRHQEKSADIRAAIEMGIANDLSEFLKSPMLYKSETEEEILNSSNSHPIKRERISYLSNYVNMNSLFYKSGLSERIKQEEKNSYPEGQLKLICRRSN